MFWSMRLIIVIISLLAAVGHSEVYKWVDENGVVHYGDRRPGQAAETVEIEVAPPVDSAQAIERNKQVNDALKAVTSSREDREGLDREQDKAIADRQAYQLKCQQVREYRDKLRSGGFLYWKDDEYKNALSDEEIAVEVAKLDQQLQENCMAY